MPDVDDAVEAASQYAPVVSVENMPHDGGAAGLGELGAVNPRRPEQALKMCGLSPMPLPMDMSLEEAHVKLLPFFPTHKFVKKHGKQVPIKAYLTPQEMSQHLLGQNYKTAKKDLAFEANTDVQGLSILPNVQISRMRPGVGRINTCVGASKACVAACLVYSGRNDADPYNAIVKAARQEAMLKEPRAFLRMLAENIARHARIRTATPYVRLNVFSDIPWELVCPELFEHFSGLQFYDYTKVEGRIPPRNYDLTFSFSGVNQPQVAHELSRGRRIAVVFVPPRVVHAEGRARGEGLPSDVDVGGLFNSALGRLPVIDGDVSDVRPRDPAPAIVGLRWKIPMGRQQAAMKQALATAFAVPVMEHDGVLIAAQSARMEPIHDADEELEAELEE